MTTTMTMTANTAQTEQPTETTLATMSARTTKTTTKTNLTLKLCLILITTFISLNNLAHATTLADTANIVMGTPEYGGNGCPENSVSITFAPDQSSFSIIYDNFSLNRDPDNHRRIQRLNCDVRIPMKLPVGFQVTLDNVDYRGFVTLPQGNSAKIEALQYFYPRRDWRAHTFAYTEKKFKGPIDIDYTLSSQDQNRHPATSACGGTVYLRMSEVLSLKGRGASDAQITLDSADGLLGGTYRLNLRKCR